MSYCLNCVIIYHGLPAIIIGTLNWNVTRRVQSARPRGDICQDTIFLPIMYQLTGIVSICSLNTI